MVNFISPDSLIYDTLALEEPQIKAWIDEQIRLHGVCIVEIQPHSDNAGERIGEAFAKHRDQTLLNILREQ